MSSTNAQDGKTNLLPAAIAFTLAVICVAGMAYSAFFEKVKISQNDVEYQRGIAERLQKIGQVDLQATAKERPLATGEEVFKAQCSACHATGVSGAPKFGDAADWAARIPQGLEALLTSALKGKGNMAPQGGGTFTDYEITRAVVYMANAAGAKFEEPAAPPAE